MRQLVYGSTAIRVGSEDLEQILATAQRNNARMGVTGLLLFNGQNYLQVLESPRDCLDRLLDHLESDHRHSGLVIMCDNEVAEAVFPDWSMRLIRLSESVDERRIELAGHLPDGLSDVVRSQIFNYAALN